VAITPPAIHHDDDDHHNRHDHFGGRYRAAAGLADPK
jgi:hypothetical protein